MKLQTCSNSSKLKLNFNLHTYVCMKFLMQNSLFHLAFRHNKPYFYWTIFFYAFKRCQSSMKHAYGALKKEGNVHGESIKRSSPISIFSAFSTEAIGAAPFFSFSRFHFFDRSFHKFWCRRRLTRLIPPRPVFFHRLYILYVRIHAIVHNVCRIICLRLIFASFWGF